MTIEEAIRQHHDNNIKLANEISEIALEKVVNQIKELKMECDSLKARQAEFESIVADKIKANILECDLDKYVLFNSRTKEELYYGGNINWVKTTEVHNCIITSTEETITQLAIEQTNCKIYPPKTLLMAMYGQGKTRGQIAKLMISAATNQACAAILLNEEVSCLDFIYELLHIKYESIRAMAQGGNQANLNLRLVGAITVILPPIDLQNQFAEKVQAIEHQKELIKKSIKEVETLFDSRMDYYFN